MQLPELRTERLLLRRLSETDDAAIFALRSDERVNKYIDRDPQNHIDQAKAFISKITDGYKTGNLCYWAICTKEDPKLIGTICIWNISADGKSGELGYELHPDHQGKGIMHEATGAVIRFAFDEMGITHLEAFTHKDNARSSHVLLKQGFVLQPDRKDPESDNLIIFTLEK